ncbi:early endosome antigen 1 isoform X3 [Drosophila teissieri]|uniref:early endosome antigen 1 isoform X3 n=1 Tax=Drosophila teissieri TaxID=7243 RepID=UPI001CB9F2B6|nr:early endosome antigen 1 isoform X3 [Drosophila teissieri]
MDMRSWRKVLLQWIGECQFIEPNYISLEQSDIESFYSIFIQKIQETETVTEEGKTALQAQPKEYRPMLQEFLSQNYTEFNTHLDDSGDLLSSDYLYVYTLLLQYSCVKKPSVFFHSICNKLPELTQTCIASFLGETVDRLLTRQYLRQSIANVAAIYRQGASASVSPCNPSTMRSPDPRGDDAPCSSSSSSSQPSSSTPQLHKHREHLRLQISASEMPPPPTPKTELLEQRTKELRALRSQLEMVRYEKTVLEEQQLEKDDLIKDLNREKMIAKIELEKLKNAKLAEEQHDDEDYVRPHEYEHMKSTLLKEIGQKEDVITEISDKLHDLRAEKSGLSERLNATGERLLEYADRIRVLESRVDDLTRMLSSRDERISSLELDKQELDQCLQEAREELHNRREVLNSSSDLLNCSLSPNTTPENLASSVIDKQLREKEHENAELKEELQKRNNSQLELCQALSSFLQKHNIDHESPVEWTSSSLLSSIAAIESNFAETVNKSAQMKEDCYVHAAHIEKLLGKCVLLSGTVESQEKELEEAKAAMVELMDSALESSREYSSMQRSFDMKIADVTSKSKEQQLDNERLNEKCAELNSMVAIGDEHLANINLQLREKEEQMKVVGAEIRDLRAKNLLLENMLSDIADKGTSEAIHTQNLQHNNKFVRSKYDVCRRELIAQNSFQDELARMLNVPDWETMNCRIAQLIEMQAEHDELNLVYARKEKQLEELSAQHDKLMQTHLELGKKKEIELKEKKAQLEEFEEHNKNLDRFLVRIRTLLGGSKRRRSSLNSSATSVESVQIEKRFEEIATLIERQLQSADALKEEISELQAKNDEVVLNYINGVKKRERIINSLEDKSEKLRSTLTALEKEICSNNKKIAELEETLSKERSNAEEVAQRLDTAQQEIEGYHVEATRFMTTISERLQQDFDGTNNTPQQLGTCMSKFLEMYDQMEARYQESSSSVEQLTQSKAQLEQQVDELQKEVASQQAINKESSSSVEQLTQSKAQLEQQVAALQKEVASQEVTNLRSGPLIKQLNDTIQNLERVNAKLSEDNSASHTARLDMSDSLLRTHNELERRINRVVHLEATERRMTTELSDCKREMNELKKELKSSEEKFAQMKQMYEAQLEALEVICDKETEEKEDLQINLRETEDVYLKSEEKYKKLVKTTEDAHEKELKSSEEKFAQMKEMYEAQLEALEVICDKETEEKEDLQISLRETEDVYLKSEEKYKKLVMTSEDAHEKLCKEHEKRCGDLQKLCDELEEQLAQKELTDSSELLITQAELQKEKELTADLKEQLDKNAEEIKSLQESQLQEQELVDQLKADFDMKQMELSKVRNELESCLLISTELEEAQVKAKEELLCLQIKLEEERNLVGSLKVELEKKQADLDGLKTALETQTKISDTREGQEKAALREVFLAKERLVKAEREFEVNLATLEDQIETLEERHIQTEAERANAYERINMLEARCLEKDDTIRTLQGQIVRVEHLQHQLQSEMGSHNSVVEQLNRELAEKASELLDVQNRLEIEIAERNQANEQLAHISNRPEVIELQHRLEAETAERIEAEKKLAEVTDRLDEVVQELDGTRLEHGAQKLKLEERAREAEQNHDELTERLGYYKERLDSLERHLAACNEELADLQSGRAKLTEATPDLGATYSTADEQHLESDQKARNNKLVLDCQILQAKYRDAKDEIQRGEQKIKDQRLEMEGKLDKMKNKMDGPHSLDDSMSALLSSSSTGARKKSMGTHYKRPGPPTPSKNGGRLSFGSSEPPREILREFGDHNNTSKTPARFKFLTQRFSVGSSGLPRDELPRRKRPNLLTGIHRRKLRQAVDFFCTSTPRKSRSYYDQQRLIRASDADKSKADETEEEVLQVDAEGVPELEPHEDADQQGTPHLSTAALLALTKGNTRRLTGPAKPKKGRVSLSLHGNIFAKSRPAAFVAGKRVQLRRKLRRERMGRFDEARHLDQVRLSYSAQTPTSAENNNYSLHNRNEEHLPSQILMGKTMVLEGKRRLSPVVSTTFNVAEHSRTSQLQQQFEHENCATWAVLDGESVLEETQDDWHFEQLCRETESTAPFQLQPLDYKPIEEPVEPKFPQLVASCSNITANSCATNMTSASSCTLYSMGSVHMQPLPSVNITYVQSRPDTQLRRPTRHRSLMTHCRQFLRHLSLGERLIVGFALLVMVGLASQLADKLVLAITGVLAGMGLVLLTYSCNGLNQKRKPKQWESHKSYY